MNGSGSPSKRMPYLHSMAKKHRRPYCNLEKSLLSCLPNEVDFAINACTLMSAQGSTVIKLPDNSRILDLLLLHIGIVSDGRFNAVFLVFLNSVKCSKISCSYNYKLYTFNVVTLYY